MSIIHDALKKIQQGQASKDGEIPTAPTSSTPPNPGYLYSAPIEAEVKKEQSPLEGPSPSPKKARSIIALLCIIAFILGSLVFSYKRLQPYFYRTERSAKSSFYKLIHQKEVPEFKTKAPQDLVPLAKITITPSNPTNMPATSGTTKIGAPETLNIHGVMANGPNNLVLINDQVYQEGDEVAGVKIVKINLDSITVINNGKEEIIPVKN